MDIINKDTEYQTLSARYYESRHDWAHAPYPTIVERVMEVSFIHSQSDSYTTLRFKDCISGYEWQGRLAELIALIAPKTQTPLEAAPELSVKG
jgi:hypothetical protein